MFLLKLKYFLSTRLNHQYHLLLHYMPIEAEGADLKVRQPYGCIHPSSGFYRDIIPMYILED